MGSELPSCLMDYLEDARIARHLRLKPKQSWTSSIVALAKERIFSVPFCKAYSRILGRAMSSLRFSRKGSRNRLISSAKRAFTSTSLMHPCR